MSRTLVLSIFAMSLALQALPATAQSRGAYNGAFERVYPEAADLLYGLDEVQLEMLEDLYSEADVAALESSKFQAYRDEMLDGADRAVSARAAMPTLARVAPRLIEVIDRAHTLRRELYDIYADPQVIEKRAAAEQAIDRYLGQPDLALPTTPKSFMIMHEQPYSMAYRMSAPRTNGLTWAGHWLQFAVFDPMMYYAEQNEREQAMGRVIERYRELVGSPPQSTPQEMPTPAAISPELTRTHPRAAAIFDNLNMLQELVADLLANRNVADKQVAINDAVGQMMNPEHMLVSNYDWLVGSLRHGIFFQGGPAIGRLDRPERNTRGGHGAHDPGQMVMPGMPSGSTGGGGGPTAPQPEPGPEPNPGVDHTQH